MIRRALHAARKVLLPGAAMAVFLAAGLALSCRAKTDEEMIAAVLDDMAGRVEKRDAEGLVAHLAENYVDFEGRDRVATQAMAEEYFRRFRGIKTKALSSRIAMGESGTATAEIDVSLYSGVASALRKAVGFSGENYRVSCVFRRESEWRISEARWEYIPVQSLFPESLQVLRELFPDL
jgi:ketosteroid isomerase-like protein